jgi:hypothetical protein
VFPVEKIRGLPLKPTRAGKAREGSKDRIGNEPAVPLCRQTYRLEFNSFQSLWPGEFVVSVL